MATGKSTRVLNIAHRGARAYAPENTLVAFAKAKTLGCDMFELDVRLSKDGEVIVYHDEHLKRCTDACSRFEGRSSYNLADFTYKEISQLDAGSWYVEQLGLPNAERQPFLQTLSDAEVAEFVSPSEQKYYASGGIKIPSLAEALSLAKELDLMINIELKNQPQGTTGLVEAVLKNVKSMKMEAQILITSFEHYMVREVRQQTKKIATGILTDTPIRAPITYLRKLKANAYNLGCYKDYQRDGFSGPLGKRYLAYIEKLRHAGFDVNVWTCNDPEEMGGLLSAGITGLISDYSNRVRVALNSNAQENS
jgi:glycerophosphoryl diester phosphodiesterase